ncbi:MAG: adenylate kinase [Anaerolineales bacterium]|uniref:Adenylate kinase n=1 Tax=Candidatus Desulfolinea nitratireducens TaxID=2841698 RepID=A0A8J6NKX0_9CHLR|nr:adenylate kinase [Candidatus Desulfolinea nitratireducens]MBL6960608.1 adenylate kinase [Anaerolineales bacterium]
MATYIVLLGPPGVGKGTQAKIVANQSGLAHISSGDLFRENIKNHTELGQLAENFINKGELVPDDLTIAMIKDRITRSDCESGAILDGFPRTPVQADAAKIMLNEIGEDIDIVPFITAPDEILVERLSGRWTCRKSGHIFHTVFNPPLKEGVCDIDGSELYQRDDDKVETVKNRIQVYLRRTSPLIAYYREQGKLVEVQGNQAIEEVTRDLLDVLAKEY